MSEESENWKDYRQGWRQITDVYTWVWRMLLGQETQKSGRKLLILFVLSNAMAMIMPWTFGHVIDRQIHQDAHHAYQWFTILSLSVLIRWYIRLREGLERERLLGSSHAEVDHVCTTLFMEKSLGQHIRESDRLSASNMEKDALAY